MKRRRSLLRRHKVQLAALQIFVFICCVRQTVSESFEVQACSADGAKNGQSRCSPTTGKDRHFCQTVPSQASGSAVGPSRPPLVLVPGYEGSIFEFRTTGRPFFLAPQPPPSELRHLALSYNPTLDLYSNLDPDLHVPLRHHMEADEGSQGTGGLFAVEYPRVSCAATSRTGHCVPEPAPGPLSDLVTALKERLNYTVGKSLFPAPYDWRLPPHHLADPGRPFAKSLTTLSTRCRDDGGGDADPVILVAHGYGCIVASRFLALSDPSWRSRHIMRLWCVGAPLTGTSDALMQFASGHSTGRSRNLFSWSNAREEGRVDFRSMEFELGLKRRRRVLLPEVSGVWDEGGEDGMISDEAQSAIQRPLSKSIAQSFGSLAAMLPNDLIASEDGVSGKVAVKIGEATFARSRKDMAKLFRTLPHVMSAMSWADDGLQAPGVPVSCVFGRGVDTPGGLTYGKDRDGCVGVGSGQLENGDDKGDWLKCIHEGMRPTFDLADGDGVVESEAGKLCLSWADDQNEDVRVEWVEGGDHFGVKLVTDPLIAFLEAL